MCVGRPFRSAAAVQNPMMYRCGYGRKTAILSEVLRTPQRSPANPQKTFLLLGTCRIRSAKKNWSSDDEISVHAAVRIAVIIGENELVGGEKPCTSWLTRDLSRRRTHHSNEQRTAHPMRLAPQR